MMWKTHGWFSFCFKRISVMRKISSTLYFENLAATWIHTCLFSVLVFRRESTHEIVLSVWLAMNVSGGWMHEQCFGLSKASLAFGPWPNVMLWKQFIEHCVDGTEQRFHSFWFGNLALYRSCCCNKTKSERIEMCLSSGEEGVCAICVHAWPWLLCV